MKIKKLAEIASAFVFSLSTLLTFAMPLTHAVPPVHTWKGGVTATSGDHKFSTAANWVENTVPASGDNLVFPNTDTMMDFSAINDLIGASFGTLTFTGNVTTGFGGSYDITGTAFTITGGIVDSSSAGAFPTISNPLTLAATPTVSATFKDSFIQLAGVLSGTGINVNTPGAVYLSADNSAYTGAITVAAGNLIAGNANAFGAATSPGAILNNGSDVAVTSCLLVGQAYADFNSKLTLNGGSSLITGDYPTPKLLSTAQACGGSTAITYGAYSSTGTDTMTFHGTITLANDVTFAGTATNTTLAGPLVGAFKITMLPGYTGKLTVASSSNGSTTVNGTYTSALFTKTLSDNLPAVGISIYGNNVITLDGSRGSVDVDQGGILNGVGTIGSLIVNKDGVVAPGHSPGCMTVTGTLLLSGTYQAQLGGTDPCTGYDQIKVSTGGTVDVNGATLATSLFGGFVPKAGQSFTIIDNQDSAAITGTFAGMAEGATFVADGVTYTITYKGGTGNDVVITVKNVNAAALPSKPNTGMMLISSHPAFAFIAATCAAATLLLTARRLQPQPAKKR